jgi:hypothetical protein
MAIARRKSKAGKRKREGAPFFISLDCYNFKPRDSM